MHGWVMKLLQIAVGVGVGWYAAQDPTLAKEPSAVIFIGFFAAVFFTALVVAIERGYWAIRRWWSGPLPLGSPTPLIGQEQAPQIGDGRGILPRLRKLRLFRLR